MRKEERGTKYSRWNEEGGERCEVLGNGMREGRDVLNIGQWNEEEGDKCKV